MELQTHADDRGSATEEKFYLPAMIAPSISASLFDRLWESLFNDPGRPSN